MALISDNMLSSKAALSENFFGVGANADASATNIAKNRQQEALGQMR